MPAPATSIEEQLVRLQALAQTAADQSLAAGPSWLADASLDALEKIRVLRANAGVNMALLPRGDDLRAHLGANWVDLHGDVRRLVLEIGRSVDGM